MIMFHVLSTYFMCAFLDRNRRLTHSVAMLTLACSCSSPWLWWALCTINCRIEPWDPASLYCDNWHVAFSWFRYVKFRTILNLIQKFQGLHLRMTPCRTSYSVEEVFSSYVVLRCLIIAQNGTQFWALVCASPGLHDCCKYRKENNLLMYHKGKIN